MLLLCKGKVLNVPILHILSCFWCRNHLSPNNPAPSQRLLCGKKQRCWWCLMRNSRCLITTDINLWLSFLHQDYSYRVSSKFNATMIWRLPSLTLQCSSQLRPFFYSYIFFTFIIWQSLLSYLRDLQQWQFFISDEHLRKNVNRNQKIQLILNSNWFLSSSLLMSMTLNDILSFKSLGSVICYE